MEIWAYTRFAHLICRFEKFGTKGFWDIWAQNIDSYQIAVKQPEPDITIRKALSSGEGMNSGYDLVLEERRSIFLWSIYRAKNGDIMYTYRHKGQDNVELRYHLNKEKDTITLLEDNTDSAGNAAYMFLALIVPTVFLPHHIIIFHGVLLESRGRGIVISAPSGTGKSTHAHLWRDHENALIINGDRAACTDVNGCWTGFGIPWSGSSGENVNRSVKLKAFVLIEQAEENSVIRLDGLNAFNAVMSNLFYPAWNKELSILAMDLVDRFISEVPIFRLRCRPEKEAVEVLEQALNELE